MCISADLVLAIWYLSVMCISEDLGPISYSNRTIEIYRKMIVRESCYQNRFHEKNICFTIDLTDLKLRSNLRNLKGNRISFFPSCTAQYNHSSLLNRVYTFATFLNSTYQVL